jgi:hypothetical protein
LSLVARLGVYLQVLDLAPQLYSEPIPHPRLRRLD